MKRHAGILRSWNGERGFGFIADGHGQEIFAHITEFRDRANPPRPGQRVRFARGSDRKGRPCARRITRADDVRRRTAFRPLLAVGFFVGLAAGVATGRVHRYVFLACLIASVLTMVSYALDKRAARAGRWRTTEARLHLMALLGGWPGALLAQQWLRHKTRKPGFQRVFWLTVLGNVGALVWLHTAAGARLLAAVADFRP